MVHGILGCWHPILVQWPCRMTNSQSIQGHSIYIFPYSRSMHSYKALCCMQWLQCRTGVFSFYPCRDEHYTTTATWLEEGESSKKLQPQDEYESFVVDTSHPDRQVRIGKALPNHIKATVQATLIEFQNILSWTLSDFNITSPKIVVHRLGIPEGTQPIIQKKRTFARQRQHVIWDKVNDLLEASIVKKIDYPVWLANPIMVPKHNTEWYKCINYTNLNKAILKKPFPLSRIYQVIDAVPRHEVLWFLDAYKGYPQIPMAPEDMEKTTFVINDGIFYYNEYHSD